MIVAPDVSRAATATLSSHVETLFSATCRHASNRWTFRSELRDVDLERHAVLQTERDRDRRQSADDADDDELPQRVLRDPEELRELCSGALARYKIPESFHVVDELPRGAMGKVKRHVLAARLGS